MRGPRLILLLCFFSITYSILATDFTITIAPRFGQSKLAIGSSTYSTKSGDTILIERLRFYLSSFVFTFENGSQYKEPDSYHLIDAEEPSSYNIILKQVPVGKISSVTFNIGVDSAMSVSGAMGGDLDPVKGMYWAWNSGYINAKLEGNIRSYNGKKSEPFEFHIGGYMQPYYALRHASVKISDYTGNNIIISPDIATWFEGWSRTKEKSIMIPGSAAMLVADRYSKMFNTAK